jgi:S-adenosylmethionine synthetase
VSVEYNGFTPIRVKKVVIATQHDDMLEKFGSEEKEHAFISKNIINKVILPVLEKYRIDYDEKFIVNGTGRFVFGGPQADTGLTGRKIIVDTYGGYARHGGGAFSGKDPSKVDRSAAYMTRYIAKNLVAAGLADRAEVQLAYSIGVAEPMSVSVETFGTGKLSDDKLTEIVKDNFGLKPSDIISHLNLKQPIYKQLAAYGHLGREGLPWEALDMINTLKKYI